MASRSTPLTRGIGWVRLCTFSFPGAGFQVPKCLFGVLLAIFVTFVVLKIVKKTSPTVAGISRPPLTEILLAPADKLAEIDIRG
jgi:hypothetical protein